MEVKLTAVGEKLETSANPAANLPFNLTLKEEEKEARSKLVLPYTLKERLVSHSEYSSLNTNLYQYMKSCDSE